MKFRTFFCLAFFALFALLAATPARATSYTLTVVTQGSGNITTNPIFATYPANVTVTLTATPATNWYFSGWSGAASGTTNVVNVPMTGNLTVTGLFLAYPLYSVALATNGLGSVVLSPLGGTYASNTLVTATATPAAGWVFTGWSGATNDLESPLSFAVDGNLSLTGSFAELPAFATPPKGITNVVGSTVSFTASAVGSGSLAYQWYFNGGLLSGATAATLTLTDTAAAEAGFYQLTVTNDFGSVTSAPAALVLTNGSQSTNVVSVCDKPALQAAISAGGWISIGCNGTITLTNTITIANHVILDASEVSATISGNELNRLFYVASGGSLSITNLTLANGCSLVNSGAAVAAGGAIYNNGGTVILTGCTLTNNQALAAVLNGVAEGGAIYNNGGAVGLYGSEVLNNTAYGSTNSANGYGAGGAIFNTGGTVIIVSTLIQSNLCTESAGPGIYPPYGLDNLVASYGGALFQSSGTLSVTNCILNANQAVGGNSEDEESGIPGPAPAYGGAVAATGGSVSLDLCELTGNTVHGGNAGFHTAAAPAFGGAVYCSNALTAVSCSFSGNQALGGNGTYEINYGPAAVASGGAIYNNGSMVLGNSLVYSNFTLGGSPGYTYPSTSAAGGNGLGGGIFNAAQLQATNCTIALNSAVASQGQPGGAYGVTTAYAGDAVGGGVFNTTNAAFSGVNVTIASNFCNATGIGKTNGYTYNNGFAAGSQVANTNGTLQLLNSLLAYSDTNENAYGIITDLGDNISSDGSANFNSGSSFNFTDPLLGPLANNGGPTLTMALLPGSPGIAYANSTDGAPPDDQRGYARPTGNGVIDLGAFQSGATQIYTPPQPFAPAFAVEPESVTNLPGSTVDFSAVAIGAAPLTYQWYANNGLLAGDTNATLTLNNVNAGDAGHYHLVVTNLYGSVTSSVAALVLTNYSESTNLVSVCDEAGLRAAIKAGGWISFGCGGTITLSSTLNIANDVILDAEGVSVTISGGNGLRLFNVAPGASLSITNVTLADGSSIVTSGTAPADGGAIYNNGGTVTLTACELSNNSALAAVYGGVARGGAIFNKEGAVRLYGSQVLYNTAFGAYDTTASSGQNGGQAFGGAIYTTNGSVTILNSQIQGNICNNAGGPGNVESLGGALFEASGGVVITNSILTGNQALGGASAAEYTGASGPTPAFGGALAAVGGSVSMNRCQLSGNTASGGNGAMETSAAPAFGGAVYCSNTLTAVSCSFSGNQVLGGSGAWVFGTGPTTTTASGGAIYNLGTVILDNCLVAENEAESGAPAVVNNHLNGAPGVGGIGGGVFNAGQLTATNCTIALNSAIGGGLQGIGTALGGGLYNAANATLLAVNVTIATNNCQSQGLAAGSQIANTNGLLLLRNSLLAYGGAPGNVYGTITDSGDNISSDGTANFGGSSSLNVTDPLLGPLANNGGPTLTMALLPGSPGIAYANSTDGAPPDDQRGYARPTGNDVIDLGAYQSGATRIYTPAPTLSLSIATVSTNVVVTFTTSPAITNTIYLQTSTNLTVWTDLATYGAFSTPSNISQTISAKGAPRRFFRLLW